MKTDIIIDSAASVLVIAAVLVALAWGVADWTNAIEPRLVVSQDWGNE